MSPAALFDDSIHLQPLYFNLQEPQQPQALGTVSEMLASAGHPLQCCFTLALTAALFTYVFLESIVVSIWSTQNVTGRLLVRLRWRSLIKDVDTEKRGCLRA
jgi:hypothetical protein